MATCPKCQANIDEDFGLVTCPQCGAQVLIEIDGISSSEAPPAVPNFANAPSSVFTSSESLPQEPPPSILVDELSQVLVADVQNETPPPQPPEVSRSRPTLEASADLRGLADFGNSDMSQGREGFLRFDLYVSGIDTADVRQAVHEILSDSRFLWDVDKIMHGLKAGEICLKEITAVKTAIVVSRMRFLPVEIRWEQYAINQG